MKLHVGERLPGAGPLSHPGGYEVTGVAAETTWYGLYTARKIFYNFDFQGKRLRETDENEWLDVYLRTINYLRLDDPADVAERRARVRTEARRVLGNRTSNLWPEPLDLLELPNTRDPFTFARAPSEQEEAVGGEIGSPLDPHFSQRIATEPILVFARPQGELLARWKQNVQPLSWILGVLAELLQFVQAAHGDRLLLNGLGPGTVLVDRVGRVHYLGTDMVVEMPPAAPGASDPPLDWARLFPPERYPRGFSAPECFDPALPRDQRTDLYGWGTIAYFLLTGDRPAQLALDQRQPWARFHEPQFVRLNRALRSIPPVHVRNWAEQLGVDSEALVHGWPHNILTVLQHCLHADPLRRPTSVADLRAWLMTPPPPPIPAALAVRVLRDEPIKVFLDIRAVDPVMTVMIRRGIGFQPTTPAEGELVSEGQPMAMVVDSGWMMPLFEQTGAKDHVPASPVHYAVFAGAKRDGRVSYSAGTVAEVIDANPADLRRCAEEACVPGNPEEPETDRVRLLFEVFDPRGLAEVLMGSPLPQVRRWAVSRLARMTKTTEVQTALWRALKDAAPLIRLEAARGLLEGPGQTNAVLVRQVVELLGAGQTDDSIAAARTLGQVGVAEEVIQATVAALERERPSACPECGLILPAHERAGHLIQTHGYLDCFGALLPRPEALARLWDRTLGQGDRAAHERLCELLIETTSASAPPVGPGQPGSAGGEPEKPAYAAALEAHLHQRAEALLAARWQELPRLVECLRASSLARVQFHHLVASPDTRVREIGRELVLPELAQRLGDDDVTPQAIRRALDEVCPRKLIDEKIQLCLALPHAGVDAAAAETCLHELQAERPVACPQCGWRVAAGNLEHHLRRAHHIYQFRGVQRSLEDTLAVMLTAVCSASPDYDAWQALEKIAREEFKDHADAQLAQRLGPALAGVSEKRRGQVVAAAAQAIVAADNGSRFALVLVEANRSTDAPSTLAHLALELAVHLPVPLDNALLSALRPLIANKAVPSDVRVEAAAALLRTTGKEGKPAADILQALVGGTGKARAIERLRELERRVGNSPAIDELCARLEDQIRMVCPRCNLQLRRPAMRDHLWQEHRLVLDGRRVREPWRLLEDWLVDYKLERDAELLARCRALAQRLDADQGLLRLSRLILAQGIDDPDARRDLLAEARRRYVSLCPHCFALVPPREEPAPAPLSISRGRLSARGYRVEVSDTGLLPRLEVEMPGQVLFRGTEPPRRLTRKGAILVLAGTPAFAALVLSLVLPALGLAALLPVSAALALALGLGLFVTVRWRPTWPPLERAVDYAWQMLVPRLHANGFAIEDSTFASGLAMASAGHGRRDQREDILKHLRRETETAVASNYGPARHLAAYWRLTIEDMARADLDPVPVVVGQIGRCFDGKLPFTYAGQLLDGWQAPWWTVGALARLRVLLCDRAFEAGLEVQDLIEIGRVTPPVGAALKIDDADGLAHLRLLWSLRPSRPWDRFGKTVTVFELANDPDTDRTGLGRHPDLLLRVEEGPATQVCIQGIVLLDKRFASPPRTVEVVACQPLGEAGYDLILDDQRFHFAADPEEAARRLERLFRYFFHDFRSQVPAVLRWRSPAVSRTLRVQNAVPCPECRQPVVVRVGEVGIPMEVAGDLEPPVRLGTG